MLEGLRGCTAGWVDGWVWGGRRRAGQMGGWTDGQIGRYTGAWKDGLGWVVGSWFSGLQCSSGRPVSAFNRMITELIPRSALLPQVGPQSPVIPLLCCSDGALM